MNLEHDRWLERWLPLMRDAARGVPVLELACDTGTDTVWLLAHDFDVVATDISMKALVASRAAAPGAMLVRHDLRGRLPFRSGSFGAVVASLCLHYFDWSTTVQAVNGIREGLRPGGLLLARVNSTNDVHHGAGQGAEIEPNYYQQDARYAARKRFFDRAALERLFNESEWEWLGCEERANHRYSKPKVAWEIVLRLRPPLSGADSGGQAQASGFTGA